MSGSVSVRLFINCFYGYMCIAVGDPIIKRVAGIPLTGLNPPPGAGFPATYILVFIVFNK